MIIGIAGLSHLGLVTAVGLAEKGFQILAWDPNVINVEDLRAGKTTISEPQLTELLSKNTNNIKFVRNCSASQYLKDLLTLEGDLFRVII